MAEITELIHHYLRHNKKFPHVFCPGCGHGIVLGALIRAIHSLELSKDEVCIVAGIGCSGRIAAYVDFNTVHTTHGRALTFATGIKMANPNMKVIAIMGDGDAFSIGGNHLIHAARRNIGVTALVLNNNIYGMTGGQCSATTPQGATTQTTPYGQMEKSFDLVDLARAAGANGVYRGTVFHVNMLDRLISTAITRPGFNLVEIMTPCHTQYGRKNKYKNSVEMFKWLKSTCLNKEKFDELKPEDREGKLPIGTFVEHDAKGLEELYEDMRVRLRTKAAKPAAPAEAPTSMVEKETERRENQ
ncbi:thiamine pyrophosphate TPP-binding domain-containing protein [Desulfovibrio sp. X2]|uniref:2-oxoacid:ferredoxin oxidoreductase subunit beta n=1 Tax=Desulfovibrio sp. X2 TaxID=941449 RepID=UPI000358D615|nr:2-oxoacid:ferredoxin oxidoreductase subunit beta [Desulfovibrio sp. X2]EPR42845.1 thiamine pyrophosphate TPP-binding domain-containing protein [Desulfovibrio sp. X2]